MLYENGKLKKIFPLSYSAVWTDDQNVLRSFPGKKDPRTSTPLDLRDLQNNVIAEYELPPRVSQFHLFRNKKRMLLKVRESKHKPYVDVSNIAIYNIETKEIKKVTNHKLEDGRTFIHGEALSPDETKVAYASYAQGIGNSIIRIIDLDGNVLEMLPYKGVTSPAWSPDGSKLVFAGVHTDGPGDYRGGIAIYDFETKEARTVIRHNAIVSSPDFSPDGKQVVYVLWGDGGRANNLAVVNIDGTGFHKILPESHARQGQISNPDWGP